MTVQFNVDGLKISHKEQTVLDNFLNKIRSEFGQENELTENKGLIHEYLGIAIDYLIVDKAVFTIFDYLEDVIVECAKDLKNSRSYYLGNNQLFQVITNSSRFPPEDADIFHCHVTRLLFESKRAKPEISGNMKTFLISYKNQKSSKRTRFVSFSFLIKVYEFGRYKNG